MASVTIDAAQPHTSAPAARAPTSTSLHTTEGMGRLATRAGALAPHDTIRAVPGVGIVVRRHFPYGHYARALPTRHAGRDQPLRVIQTELGRHMRPQAPRRPGLVLPPDADDVVLRALADYYRPTYAR